MTTKTQDTILGGIRKSAAIDRKMTMVLGEPGEGKTVTLLDFCSQNTVPSYYFRCSTTTSMRSLLIFMANAVGAHVSGRNDEIQEEIQKKLKEDNNYCFVFDEIENLVTSSCSKIDVIRQIYDSSNVQTVLCGTYDFKDMICGEKKKSSRHTHNRPQIFRRLRKEEFQRITEAEIYEYLTLLEKEYAVSFDKEAKESLVSTCRDRQNGGLGNFIEIIELLFSYVRPEWIDISYQLIEKTGRKLHTHSEDSQSFTALKPEDPDEELSLLPSASADQHLENPNKNKSDDHKSGITIDVGKLPVVNINLALLKDAKRHKMEM